MNKISVVIVTKNSFRDKDGSIETVLASLDGQSHRNFKIALIDNGSTPADQEQLKVVVNQFTRLNVDVRNADFAGVAPARNQGASLISSDIIVFMDDDSVLLHPKTIDLIIKASMDSSYGYGAVRMWTDRSWYQSNKVQVNLDARAGEFTRLIKASGEPDPTIRRKSNNKYLNRSFIGNFGFVKREPFEKIGGWPECFTGYGCEDDAMAFLLFKEFGRPYIFSSLQVGHVTHDINELSFERYEQNLVVYRSFLARHGVSKFHIGDLMYQSFEREITES